MSARVLTERKTNTDFPYLIAMCLFVIVLGCLLRFFEITAPSFIFYDEGMYLHYNSELLDKIHQFPPKDANEGFAIGRILFLSALTTAKWLWFLISNLRVFFGGPDALFFTRVISALSGVATIWLTYKLARRLYRSREVAYLGAAILAMLPSHVFYSRLAMQEAFSTLCFLSGVYLYCSARKGWGRLTASAVFFSAVYFTNYRMIVLPVLLAVIEGMLSLSEKRRFDWIKCAMTVGGFLGIILFFGLLNNGSNLFITSAWMGKQAEMAPQQWQWVNLLSYPWEIFRLEGGTLFLVLVMSGYFIFEKNWLKALPLAVVCAQMFIFTFASEKGARYLCVVTPLMALAAAVVMDALRTQGNRIKVWAPPVLLILLLGSLVTQSLANVSTPQGYRQAVEFIRHKDPNTRILTSQPLLVSLLSNGSVEVQPVPKSLPELMARYSQGFRYLIIDPQAYVSWTASGERFTWPLVDYLGFVVGQTPPVVGFPHLKPALLERFVWDHNEGLRNSIEFLGSAKTGEGSRPDFGAVYVYDLTVSMQIMQKVIQTAAHQGTVQ